MRHRNAGRHLSRTSAHRKALRRNMAASLFEHGTIRTTPAKAKEVRRFAERLITIARKGTLHARRRVIALLGDRNMADPESARGDLLAQTVIQKLFDDIAPRYVDRPGGYTRLIRLPERRIGDSGEQVLLQLVEETPAGGGEAGPVASRRRKAAARRAEVARASAKVHVDEPAGKADEPEEAQAEETPQDEESGGEEEEIKE